MKANLQEFDGSVSLLPYDNFWHIMQETMMCHLVTTPGMWGLPQDPRMMSLSARCWVAELTIVTRSTWGKETRGQMFSNRTVKVCWIHKTNLGHVAHIVVDHKAEVSEVDISRASKVKVVKPLDIKFLTKGKSIEMVNENCEIAFWTDATFF